MFNGLIPNTTVLFRVTPSGVVPSSGVEGDYPDRVREFTNHVATLAKATSRPYRSGDVDFIVESDMSEKLLTMLLEEIARHERLPE